MAGDARQEVERPGDDGNHGGGEEGIGDAPARGPDGAEDGEQDDERQQDGAGAALEQIIGAAGGHRQSEGGDERDERDPRLPGVAAGDDHRVAAPMRLSAMRSAMPTRATSTPAISEANTSAAHICTVWP